ncbi:MAG: hypothetical protein FWF05_01705 [Oscillospiraceae bacterium]|nr:hypothetical protein [Oscillospiraceae bacterium]
MKFSCHKIGHAYFLAVFLCLCLTAAACGFVIADDNTRAVQSGYADAVVAAAQRDKSITVSVDESEFCLRLPENFSAIAELLPCPAGNLFSIYAEIRNIILTGAKTQ